jgi:hypothetical protein
MFVDMLTFMRDYENLPLDEGLKITQLLMKLFDLRLKEILRNYHELKSLTLTIKIYLLGSAKMSLALAEQQPKPEDNSFLWKVPTYHFKKTPSPSNATNKEWRLTDTGPSSLSSMYIPSYMVHFNLKNLRLHGVVSKFEDSREMIWHIPETSISFVLRKVSHNHVTIIGRAFAFDATESRSLSSLVARPKINLDYDTAQSRLQNVTLDLRTLIELLYWATSLGWSSEEPYAELADQIEQKAQEDGEAAHNARKANPLIFRDGFWREREIKIRSGESGPGEVDVFDMDL